MLANPFEIRGRHRVDNMNPGAELEAEGWGNSIKALAEIRSPKPTQPHMIASIQPVPMMIVIPPARIPEEPGAVIPHAGISEGGVEHPASLP